LQVGGGTSPQVVVNDSDCRITVTEGTLVLRPDRSFDMEIIEVNECPSAIGDVSVPFPARFADQRLVITYGFRYGELVFDLRNS
jgi:hypothetical protein